MQSSEKMGLGWVNTTSITAWHTWSKQDSGTEY